MVHKWYNKLATTLSGSTLAMLLKFKTLLGTNDKAILDHCFLFPATLLLLTAPDSNFGPCQTIATTIIRLYDSH